ncbi:MAG: hypothetical protein AB4911_20305 [Oscillochloridaceae bacterium umkhey_bin13]
MTTPNQDAQCHALIALLRTVPAQPIAPHTPLTLLRPLFAGTMTIAEALSPPIQEALAACEQLAYQHGGRGSSLCSRLADLPAIPASHAIDGW